MIYPLLMGKRFFLSDWLLALGCKLEDGLSVSYIGLGFVKL